MNNDHADTALLANEIREAGIQGVLREPAADEKADFLTGQSVWETPAGRLFVIGHNEHGLACVVEYTDEMGHESWIECVTVSATEALRSMIRSSIAKTAVEQCVNTWDTIQGQDFSGEIIPVQFVLELDTPMSGYEAVFTFETGTAALLQHGGEVDPGLVADLVARITGDAQEELGSWFRKVFELAAVDADTDQQLAQVLHSATAV